MPPERAKSWFDQMRDALTSDKASQTEVRLDGLTALEEPAEMHPLPEVLREEKANVAGMAENLPLKKEPPLDYLREWEQKHE